MEKGTLLKKRYLIEKTLGRGGFGVTYLARDLQSGRPCALKYLSLAAAKDTKSVELFQREAQVLSNLDHPNIPDFIDFFQEETENDISVCLVQEYIPGRNLAERLKDGELFTERRAVGIGIAVCKILEYLHGFSPPVIHRDIKPSNILIGADGGVYLIDFGAVRDKMLPRDTLDATIVGTYGYMPMEQFGGLAVPGSDIYALGVTLIAILTRREPADLARKNFRLSYKPHTKVSRGFARVLDRMIEPDHRKRHPTAQQLRAELERLLTPAAGKRPRGRQIGLAVGVLVMLTAIGLIFHTQPRKPVAPVIHKKPQVTRPARPPSPEPAEPVKDAATVIHIPFDGNLEGPGARPTFHTHAEGSLRFAAGKRGQAVQLVNSGIEYVENGEHTFKGSYTVQFWFLLDQVPAHDEILPLLRSALLTIDIRRGGESMVFVHGAAGGHMQMNVHDRTSPVIARRWYHMAVVKKAAAGKMVAYLNGKAISGISHVTMETGNTLDVFTLGTVPGSSRTSFCGMFDEFKAYDYARTSEQILADFLAGTDGGQGGVHETYTVSGRLLFDGRPITQFTNEPAHFWFRNEATGREQTVETRFANGRFHFDGLSPGRYGVDVSVKAEPGATFRSPGTFKAWHLFSVLGNETGELEIQTHRVIHLRQPQDNSEGLARWDAQCEGKMDFPAPVLFEWEPVAEGALYRYRIERWSCEPFRRQEVMLAGSMRETTLRANLPSSLAKEMFILTLSAEKDGRRVGGLETYGKVGGRGWDYRFRVR